ncbi:hypothetical protein G6L37_00420 [Agrobacterium rubi]|nr:hypothetical protein [Agrobacterium rubi]NTF23853.1 hypothetical protein [Agrobacterium rubi]
MGDRANIQIREGSNSVYLYTHWHGSETPAMLHRALHRGRERWTHPDYLARIIFCEMVRGNEMDLTGFGISSTEMGASKHILVDTNAQTVTIDSGEPTSFEDYLAAPVSEEDDENEEVKGLEEMATSAAPTREEIIATASQFQFFAFVTEFYWHNADDDLARIVSSLSEKLTKVNPVLEAGADMPEDRHGLTALDYAYSGNFWRLWHRSPIIEAIKKRNWSLAHVHIEMVAMLRALIALDTTGKLREWDVPDATRGVKDVEEGYTPASTVMSAELDRFSRYEAEGHAFRYGAYLALRMLREGVSCEDLAKRLADELGFNDPMYRREGPFGEHYP